MDEYKTLLMQTLLKAWECGYILVFDEIWTIESDEDLFEWASEQKGQSDEVL